MAEYEYKVIAAPTRGVKAKGVRAVEDRFSHALELKMNEMAAQGWEYQRAEALPSVERAGLASSKTVWHNVLVFRRSKAGSDAVHPRVAAAESAVGLQDPKPADRPDVRLVADRNPVPAAKPAPDLRAPFAADRAEEPARDTPPDQKERAIKSLIAER